MNLRPRILLTTGLLLGTLLAGLYGFASQQLAEGYRRFERAQLHLHLEGVRRMLDYELAGLDAVALDWSAWDETYAFMREPQQGFLDRNLAGGALGSISVDLMLFVDAAGRPVVALRERGAPGSLPVPVPGRPALRLVEPLAPADAAEVDALLQLPALHAGVTAPVRGVMRAGTRLLLVAARPVTTSLHTGPARGALLVARELDAAGLATLAELARVGLAFAPDAPTTAFPPDGIVEAGDGEAPPYGLLVLADLRGGTAAVLRTAPITDLREQAAAAESSLRRSLLLAGGLCVLLLLWVLERQVLRRIAAFDAVIRRIRGTQDVRTHRLPSAGRDELGRLGEAVNDMLDTLALDHQQLVHAASHDTLTGLANRRRLFERLETEIGEAVAGGRRLAVLLIDLDGFKTVNDTLGHAAGDELLRHVAQRLRDTLRRSDLAARLGGDEFIAVLGDVDSTEDAAWVARKCLAALARPVPCADTTATVSASIGIALCPEHGSDVAGLLAAADAAMYAAKQAGKATWSLAASGA